MIPGRRLLQLMMAGLLVAVLPVVVSASWWPVVPGMWLVLASGAVVDVILLRRARPRVVAVVPRSVGVGDDVPMTLQVALGGTLPLRATLLLDVRAPLLEPAPRQMQVAPGETQHVVRVHASRRGEGGLSAMWVRWRGPLGLVDRIDHYAQADAKVSVLPNSAHVRRFAARFLGSNPQTGGAVLARSRGSGRELDTLELFQPGMDVRDVDWKVSARHQLPSVRRYRFERNERVVVCLDTGRLMSDAIEGLTRLDHAVHAALLLSYAALRGGDLVGLQAYGNEPRAWVPPANGIRHLRRLSEACSRLHPEDDETNHVRGMGDLLMRMRRRSLVVVLTEFTDGTTAALMVDHLAALARRHLVVFVALDDPQVEEPLTREPSGLDDIARGVVACSLRADRHRVLQRIRRLGVHVIHAPPGPASVALVSRYTSIKRRGLIG